MSISSWFLPARVKILTPYCSLQGSSLAPASLPDLFPYHCLSNSLFPQQHAFLCSRETLPQPSPQSASSNQSDVGLPLSSSERPSLRFLYIVACASPSPLCEPVLFPSQQLSISELLTLPYIFVHLRIASLPAFVSCCITSHLKTQWLKIMIDCFVHESAGQLDDSSGIAWAHVALQIWVPTRVWRLTGCDLV